MAPARAQLLQGFDRTGDRDVEPLDRVDQLGAADEARPGVGPLEIGPAGALRRKGVGLVLKPADRDPRHSSKLHDLSDTIATAAATQQHQWDSGRNQFSICSPSMRENSRSLAVTSVQLSASAWAPINISFDPTGTPRCSRLVRISP